MAAGEAEPLAPGEPLPAAAPTPATAAGGRNAVYGVALSGNGLLAASLRDSGSVLSGKRTLPQWQRCVLSTVELLRGVSAADLPAAARRAAAALPKAPLTALRLWDAAVGLRLARTAPATAAVATPAAAGVGDPLPLVSGLDSEGPILEGSGAVQAGVGSAEGSGEGSAEGSGAPVAMDVGEAGISEDGTVLQDGSVVAHHGVPHGGEGPGGQVPFTVAEVRQVADALECCQQAVACILRAQATLRL